MRQPVGQNRAISALLWWGWLRRVRLDELPQLLNAQWRDESDWSSSRAPGAGARAGASHPSLSKTALDETGIEWLGPSVRLMPAVLIRTSSSPTIFIT